MTTESLETQLLVIEVLKQVVQSAQDDLESRKKRMLRGKMLFSKNKIRVLSKISFEEQRAWITRNSPISGPPRLIQNHV